KAKDGMRHGSVTGVQTCALPIFTPATPSSAGPSVPLVADHAFLPLGKIGDQGYARPSRAGSRRREPAGVNAEGFPVGKDHRPLRSAERRGGAEGGGRGG